MKTILAVLAFVTLTIAATCTGDEGDPADRTPTQLPVTETPSPEVGGPIEHAIGKRDVILRFSIEG